VGHAPAPPGSPHWNVSATRSLRSWPEAMIVAIRSGSRTALGQDRVARSDLGMMARRVARRSGSPMGVVTARTDGDGAPHGPCNALRLRTDLTRIAERDEPGPSFDTTPQGRRIERSSAAGRHRTAVTTFTTRRSITT